MTKTVPSAKNRSAKSKNTDIKIKDGTENKVKKFKKFLILSLLKPQV